MNAKAEILQLLADLPDAPTYADAFDRLRPLYNRAVAPIIAQYGEPPRPLGAWRRHINGTAEVVEHRKVRIGRADLLSLVQHIPEDGSASGIVDEALYQLVLSFSIDRACQLIADGMGLPREEVKQRMPILAA